MDEPSLNPYESPQEVDTRSTRRPKPKQRPNFLHGIGRVELVVFGFIALIMLHSFLFQLCNGGFGNSDRTFPGPPTPPPVTNPASP